MNAMTEYGVRRLEELADPTLVRPMQAFMGTDAPFHGVAAAERTEIVTELTRRFPVLERSEYLTVVDELWSHPQRDAKYLAIELADRYGDFVAFEQLPLFEHMIRDGRGWDLVDPIATHLVGAVVVYDPERGWPVVDRWIDDEERWVRRAAIICQVKSGSDTDAGRLFRYCLTRAWEDDPVVAQAIGWALLRHSYVDPDAVREFLDELGTELSPRARRDAGRHLSRIGLLEPADGGRKPVHSRG